MAGVEGLVEAVEINGFVQKWDDFVPKQSWHILNRCPTDRHRDVSLC
jgi:hypothetical protein